jgi:hypothetical protein
MAGLFVMLENLAFALMTVLRSSAKLGMEGRASFLQRCATCAPGVGPADRLILMSLRSCLRQQREQWEKAERSDHGSANHRSNADIQTHSEACGVHT